MTKCFFLDAVFALLAVGCFGQHANDKIYQQFMAADSVILVSHLTTNQPRIDKVNNKIIDPYRLVEKNKVNSKIIKEKYCLDQHEIEALAIIMTEVNTDSSYENIRCFIPHHGILIYKKSRRSFFDICFSCRHFITSKDIKLTDELSHNTWLHLFEFFKTRNLNYKLSGEAILKK